jgi:CTP:molybdopterin cytidylyltransferase MocA
LTGPSGAKAVLERHTSESVAVQLDDAHVVDIDTRADLERLEAATRTPRA